MIGAPVPGVVNALQVTIPGRSRQGAGERQKKNNSVLQYSGFLALYAVAAENCIFTVNIYFLQYFFALFAVNNK